MATYAFLLDLTRCIGCQACIAACKTGNELSEGDQYIKISERTRGTFPNLRGWIANHRCYHCTNAACVSVCPADALWKEDGMTRLDLQKCIGCGYCVDACPFEVPVMFDGKASKCDGCATVVRAGGRPWCVKTCPTGALLYGERDAMLAEAQTRVDARLDRYPKARVYGERELGGLGLIMVVPDNPRTLDLVTDPVAPPAVAVWQEAVQPATLGFTGLSAIITAFAAIVARRNHLREIANADAKQRGEGR